MNRWPRLLFGFTDRVGRKEYVRAGIALMLLKYAGEIALVKVFGGAWLTPWQFLSPFLSDRAPYAMRGAYFGFSLLWTLPFAWVGAGMSVRRSVDAGGSPWVGTLLFVPLANYVTMFLLSVLPTRAPQAWTERAPTAAPTGRGLPAVLVVTAAMAAALVLISTNLARSYGQVLFVSTPTVLGGVVAWWVNRHGLVGLRRTLAIAVTSQCAFALLLILLALEGGICVLMALPLLIFQSALGAAIGYAIVRHWTGGVRPALYSLALLPAFVFAEALVHERQTPPVFEVVSAVDIAATPETVWRSVVTFPELPPPREWLFRAGISYPMRATIRGEGVGAERRCEFSTGAFVEPITAWDPPRRLAFGVSAQPDPMRELSPYGPIRAPHLEGFFAATAGEFRLVPLANGRTRLEGSTWYRLAIHPLPYWRLYADALLHRIHLRVLEHIRAQAEP